MMTFDYDRDAFNDAMGESRHECGECGLWCDENAMTPLQDRYGTWWRCPSCGERDAREYEAAVA